MEPRLSEPERVPPRGVPRWLWPPPGATVRRVVIREEATSGGIRYSVLEGGAPEAPHLRALQWLVGEFPRAESPAEAPSVTEVLLEIARTEMRAGRVGHAYALDGGALGSSANHVARGVLWRYAIHVLGLAPESFAVWREDM